MRTDSTEQYLMFNMRCPILKWAWWAHLECLKQSCPSGWFITTQCVQIEKQKSILMMREVTLHSARFASGIGVRDRTQGTCTHRPITSDWKVCCCQAFDTQLLFCDKM